MIIVLSLLCVTFHWPVIISDCKYLSYFLFNLSLRYISTLVISVFLAIPLSLNINAILWFNITHHFVSLLMIKAAAQYKWCEFNFNYEK